MLDQVINEWIKTNCHNQAELFAYSLQHDNPDNKVRIVET